MISDAEWAEFERLKEFLKGYTLSDIFAAIAELGYQDAQNLKLLGYHDSGAELEKLAETVGCISVPGIPVNQKGGAK